MSEIHTVGCEANLFIEIRRRILELYPDIDEQTLSDTLEGATNLHEAIGALISSALEDETFVKALKARIEQMQTRLGRFNLSAAAKRKAAGEAMEKAGLTKLIAPEFTASMRKNARGAIIEQVDEIPAEFWVDQEPKLDRNSVREALLNGRQVPGAMLSEQRTILSVRVS